MKHDVKYGENRYIFFRISIKIRTKFQIDICFYLLSPVQLCSLDNIYNDALVIIKINLNTIWKHI